MIREFNSEADSSTIHSASYNDETLEMLLHFKSSFAAISYAYKNVPVEVFEEFASAESKGTAEITKLLTKLQKLCTQTVGNCGCGCS